MEKSEKNQVVTAIAAILTTLLETNGTSESMLYIFFDMNMSKYQMIRDIMLDAKFIQIKGNFVTLTESGKATAEKINKATTPPVS